MDTTQDGVAYVMRFVVGTPGTETHREDLRREAVNDELWWNPPAPKFPKPENPAGSLGEKF